MDDLSHLRLRLHLHNPSNCPPTSLHDTPTPTKPTKLTSPSQVDFGELAGRLGMSNIRSASNAWAALRKKIQERNPNPDGSPVLMPAKRTPAAGTGTKRKKGGVPSTPVTPTPFKSEAGTPAGADGDDSSVEEVSIKPAAKRVKRVVPGLADPQGEVGDMVLPEEEAVKTPAPKARKPRAPRVKKEKAIATVGVDGEEVAAVLKKTPAKTATPRKRAPKVVKSDAVVKEEDDGSQEAEVAATAAAAVEAAKAVAGEGSKEEAAMDEDDEGVDVIGGEV